MPEEKNESSPREACGLPKRRRAAEQRHQPARGLMSAISREPYFLDLCRGRSAMRRLREDPPALHPARETSSPRAGDKKRVWNVRADGNHQRYPTSGVGIARRHRVTSL